MKRLALAAIAILAAFDNAFGYSYQHLSDGKYVSIHVLTVDPTQDAIQPAKASGVEPVAKIAKRYGATAAINGGFWQPNGNPAGILKINNVWLGTPSKPRGAIGWTQNGKKALIDRVVTNFSLKKVPPNQKLEVIPVTTPPHSKPEQWAQFENIVGGSPVLVMNGMLVQDFSSEQSPPTFHTTKHPRTAVGLKKSGEWVFVVVDGRIHGFLGGMTSQELAALMLQLGCVEALNLDGGGSSTMVIGGKVINQPFGMTLKEGIDAEAVGDAILIFSK